MAYQSITYKSTEELPGSNVNKFIDTSAEQGLKCQWSVVKNLTDHHPYYSGLTLSWNFDWTVLKAGGIDGLSGHITVKSPQNWFNTQQISVNLQKPTETITLNIYMGRRSDQCSFVFEYNLTPYRNPEPEDDDVCYDKMFLPSDQNDAILVVDGHKLHVNKAFLSYHSEFFRDEFKSKDGQEITIENVSYEDFGLVMSTIYPMTVYPNDQTVGKLLELADRFKILSIIGHVANHLIYNSKISHDKKTWMADEYGMGKLMKKCLREMVTVEQVRKLKASPEYEKLSEDAKSDVCDRLMELI